MSLSTGYDAVEGDLSGGHLEAPHCWNRRVNTMPDHCMPTIQARRDVRRPVSLVHVIPSDGESFRADLPPRHRSLARSHARHCRSLLLDAMQHARFDDNPTTPSLAPHRTFLLPSSSSTPRRHIHPTSHALYPFDFFLILRSTQNAVQAEGQRARSAARLQIRRQA